MGSTSPTIRTASISRITNETQVQISLSLDGDRLPAYEPSSHFPSSSTAGVTPSEKTHATQFTASQQITIDTGIGFLDHMLHALAKHAGWSLGVRCKGDLYSTLPMPHCPFYVPTAPLANPVISSRRPPHNRRHLPRPRRRLQSCPRPPHLPHPLRARRRPPRRSRLLGRH